MHAPLLHAHGGSFASSPVSHLRSRPLGFCHPCVWFSSLQRSPSFASCPFLSFSSCLQFFLFSSFSCVCCQSLQKKRELIFEPLLRNNLLVINNIFLDVITFWYICVLIYYIHWIWQMVWFWWFWSGYASRWCDTKEQMS